METLGELSRALGVEPPVLPLKLNDLRPAVIEGEAVADPPLYGVVEAGAACDSDLLTI